MRCANSQPTGRGWRVGLLLMIGAMAGSSPASARNASPPSGARPVFEPGLYETESRNSAFRGEGVRKRECLTSIDADAFQRDTIARYRQAPQFHAVCRLSDVQPTADGFAFAMDCNAARTIVTYHFAKELVSSVVDTKIPARPEYSSLILTLSRRVGACPARPSRQGP